MDSDEQVTISIENYLPDITTKNIREEIISGLTAEKKYISSKYFYNEKGSLLFEKITELDEYYPTRTEKAIIQANAKALAQNITDTTIIELGSGDCSKIFILLDAISKGNLHTITYSPVDFSFSAIEDSTKCLSKKYPDLRIKGYAADFLHRLDYIPSNGRKLICFFGSTIGNLTRTEGIKFIKEVGAMMNKGDTFILGMDMVKDKSILEKAYNDCQLVTASFNKNIINTINPIIGTNINPENFEHKAFYNEDECRIEMHLMALTDMRHLSPHSDKIIEISEGENIHTENSHKFTKAEIENFANSSGLKIKHIFTDEPNSWFSLVMFEKIGNSQ